MSDRGAQAVFSFDEVEGEEEVAGDEAAPDPGVEAAVSDVDAGVSGFDPSPPARIEPARRESVE